MKRLLAPFLFLSAVAAVAAVKPAARAVAAVQPVQIRVLVALGPSTYFFRDGRPHGLEYAWLLEYEKFINQGRDKSRQFRLQFIPVDPGELIPALFEGRGELAAGLIPASDGVRQLVTLTDPFLVDQWCVAGNRADPLPQTLDEIAAHGVLQPIASYARRLLLDVNEARRGASRPEIVAEDAESGVTAEKLLGDIHRGGKSLTLSSRLVAGLWGKVFPKATLGSCLDIPVFVAWAVQKDNLLLQADLNRFIAEKRNTFVPRGIELTRKYLHPDGVGKPSRAIDPLDKLAFFAPLFQLAASANNLDWFLLAAIGQRETGLRAVSRVSGPTGVMQITPETARMMGVKNPQETGPNITAAARYLSYLQEMFNSPEIAPDDRLYFMLAAYNAGEGRLQRLRDKAAAEGLNPNRWHGNVEVVAQRTVGQRMVDYVSAVSRYYLAYQIAERRRSLEAIRTASAPAHLASVASP